MAMSRKHYRQAAEIIRDQVTDARTHPEAMREAEMRALRGTARGLASMFKADNSAFDRDRFLDACGL